MTTKITLLAIDRAEGRFQVCAAGADARVLSNRVLSRTRLSRLLSEQPFRVVMAVCATSHH